MKSARRLTMNLTSYPCRSRLEVQIRHPGMRVVFREAFPIVGVGAIGLLAISAQGKIAMLLHRTLFAVVGLTVALASVHPLASEPVPVNLQVSEDYRAFLTGAAQGTQNYVCLPSGASYAWTLFGPQATLFNDDDDQIITHFLSANPAENGTPRATWQSSRDTSRAWAFAIANSTDPNYVAPNS